MSQSSLRIDAVKAIRIALSFGLESEAREASPNLALILRNTAHEILHNGKITVVENPRPKYSMVTDARNICYKLELSEDHTDYVISELFNIIRY
jgi:hypothetical protein